jgi:hypothetical protein
LIRLAERIEREAADPPAGASQDRRDRTRTPIALETPFPGQPSSANEAALTIKQPRNPRMPVSPGLRNNT